MASDTLPSDLEIREAWAAFSRAHFTPSEIAHIATGHTVPAAVHQHLQDCTTCRKKVEEYRPSDLEEQPIRDPRCG